VNVAGKGFSAGPPVAFAAHCADVDLVRAMVAKGALKRSSDARFFLWSSVASGHPGMVALALTHYGNVNSKGEDGTPLLSQAAGSYVDDDAPGVASFDSAKVVEILIDAGADPNARDEDGKTPIFEANDAAVTAALLRRGADPNARDNAGQTALFDRYFAEAKIVLVASGVDIDARDKLGRTALFYQDYPDSIKALLDAGANLDAVDLEGLSAIEQMNSESGTSALLTAGAKLPSNPARLNAMIATATEKKWTGLLPLLEAAAGK
jgi:cytohesin